MASFRVDQDFLDAFRSLARMHVGQVSRTVVIELNFGTPLIAKGDLYDTHHMDVLIVGATVVSQFVS